MICTSSGGCSLEVRWNSPSKSVNFHPPSEVSPVRGLLNRRALPFPAGMTTLPVWLEALFSMVQIDTRLSEQNSVNVCVCASECLHCLSAMRSIKLS